MPHDSATSTTPDPTIDAARLVACCDDPHWLSTVVAATSSGSPALSQAVRAMLNVCSPTWLTHPPIDLTDLERVDPGPVDRGLLHRPQEHGRVHGGEPSVAPAERGSHRFDHYDVVVGEFCHCTLPLG